MDNTLKNTDKNFPKLLKQIYESPSEIYCLGNVDLLNEEKIIAVVGSRQMSRYGKEAINILIPELVKNNFVIVSGMALGVDAEVHKVCLENKGKTIAVLASGVDVVSPKSNEWIYKMILENNGLIISEYKNATMPQKENFLKRNRIVAGISKGVLVIEGGRRSGSLVTAKLALEQGREVMAVPGRINDENSWTPNYLIKNGAIIVTELQDVFL